MVFNGITTALKVHISGQSFGSPLEIDKLIVVHRDPKLRTKAILFFLFRKMYLEDVGSYRPILK